MWHIREQKYNNQRYGRGEGDNDFLKPPAEIKLDPEPKDTSEDQNSQLIHFSWLNVITIIAMQRSGNCGCC